MVVQSSGLRQQTTQLARSLLEQKPVFLDTETTGLDRTSEIVEIAIVDWDGQILYDSLIRPLQPIPPGASRVHHITNEVVKSAPTWPVAWVTIRPLLLNRLIVIYNEDFDLRLMRQTHLAHRLKWTDHYQTSCLMRLYAQYSGEWDHFRRSYRYHSLEDAGRRCHISLPNAHRAAADCLLSRALLYFMAGVEDANRGI